MSTHIWAPARWCNQKRMMEWCRGWRRPVRHKVSGRCGRWVTQNSQKWHYTKNSCWSVAMRLEGGIFALQKKGWVRPLCPPLSSFSASLPSQRNSCWWKPSSLWLLQSEQHVPRRSETARLGAKVRNVTGVFIRKDTATHETQLVPDRLYFTAQLTKIFACVRHDRQVMWML